MDNTLQNNPFVSADITIIRNSLAEMLEQGVSLQSCQQVLELVASTLEAEALLACLGGRNELYGLSVNTADALHRADELRALVESLRLFYDTTFCFATRK